MTTLTDNPTETRAADLAGRDVVDNVRAQTVQPDEETLQAVRPEIRKILEASPAFAQLPDDEKKDLASTMVKVAAYMANPDGLVSEQFSRQATPTTLARGKGDAVEATKKRLSQAPGFAGEDFQAGAVQQGVEAFGDLVQKVDFPSFVAGLIENVFQAIVDSSIQQMQAYGELLANVAKTIDQFARDNISENNARDWLGDSFSDELGIETTQSSFGFAEGEEPEETPRLVAIGDEPEEALRRISEELGLERPVTDLSDEAEEKRLVLGARLAMARSRQQLLASMVVLGINRIVVTDGRIRAKVVFSMRASDVAARRARASMYDRQETSFALRAKAKYGGWFSPVSGSMQTDYQNRHMATVGSAVDETSESKAEVKANLSGEVRVNFKSDYFPMEKLASPEMIGAIQGNAQPREPATESA